MSKYGISALALGFVLLSLSMLLQPSAQGAIMRFCYPLKPCRGFYSEVGGDKCIFDSGDFRVCEFAIFSSCGNNAGYPCNGVLEHAKMPCLVNVTGCN